MACKTKSMKSAKAENEETTRRRIGKKKHLRRVLAYFDRKHALFWRLSCVLFGSPAGDNKLVQRRGGQATF